MASAEDALSQQQLHAACTLLRDTSVGLLLTVLCPHLPRPLFHDSSQVVKKLAQNGVKMIAMRCAGFDRVDLNACVEHGIKVARVPTYSPTSVAEHAVSLLMALNRCEALAVKAAALATAATAAAKQQKQATEAPQQQKQQKQRAEAPPRQQQGLCTLVA